MQTVSLGPWGMGSSVLPCPCQPELALEGRGGLLPPGFSEHSAHTAGLSLVSTPTEGRGLGASGLPAASSFQWAPRGDCGTGRLSQLFQ